MILSIFKHSWSEGFGPLETKVALLEVLKSYMAETQPFL